MITFVRPACVSAFALFALGCAVKGSSDDDVGSTSSDAESSESGEAFSCEDPAADGLALRDVAVFQTIAIPVAADCEAIAPTARTAPIVAGRIAMLRATVSLGATWPATEVIARVELESSSGSEQLVGTCTRVDAGAGTADLQVELPAAAIATDTHYAVSVTTCAGEVLGAFPEAGTIELGAETTGIMRLHVVPFEVGGFVPDTSQAVLDGFRDAVLAHYPVTDVELTVGAVEPDTNGGVVDMGALLVRIVELQDPNVADPSKRDIYYYGMVSGAATREQFCESCPTGTSEAGLGDRAGSSVGAAFGDALSESTLVHELGHLHGLLHSPCGEPDLQDPDFPYADGTTHTEGWDFRTGELIPPSANDMMGYCQPRWVSDYNYRKLVDWVQRASTWRDA
ncbi:MAG TPA: M66 family metalloprotease [Nannocystaceae bacterium]|nr:M66 family metalloprotease [Nannocystaceae bacterium]